MYYHLILSDMNNGLHFSVTDFCVHSMRSGTSKEALQ